MRIIGPPSERRDLVEARLREFPIALHTRFIGEMFPALWDAALRYTIDPVGVVAQSIKETGGGMFGGKARPEFRNTGGLKIAPDQQSLFPGVTDNDNPLAHALFPSWPAGALAHVQHLRAYTGWAVVGDVILSPRYPWVLGQHAIENFEELGGYDDRRRIQWAPSEAYGAEVVAIARKLQGK